MSASDNAAWSGHPARERSTPARPAPESAGERSCDAAGGLVEGILSALVLGIGADGSRHAGGHGDLSPTTASPETASRLPGSSCSARRQASRAPS